MKFMNRKSTVTYSWHVRASRQLLATMALSLGLLAGSAVVPDVANAAAPGTYRYATQRVCFITPVTQSGVTNFYPYSNGTAGIQAWVPGYGSYTTWEGKTDNQGCVNFTYLPGWHWRVAATADFTTTIGTRVFYGARSDWFWIDGSQGSYPTVTFKMDRAMACALWC